MRLSVTDRCNLRCNYCMPEAGINFAPRHEVLSLEELYDLSAIAVRAGIRKIRITGGEPFVRRDLMVLLRRLSKLQDLESISITTNATLIGEHLEELKALNINKINVSLDAIHQETFHRITRRDEFDTVMSNLLRMVDMGFEVRVNCIALEGQNTDELLDLLELARKHPISVRFLEEMPFNGGSGSFDTITWDYKALLDLVRSRHPDLEELPSPPGSTSINYRIPGFLGSFGLIPSFSRTFCGTCNRLRVSATGDLINCLYAKPSNNIREALRGQNPEQDCLTLINRALADKAIDGKVAEEQSEDLFPASMTAIGG